MERLLNFLTEASKECGQVDFNIVIRDGYFVVDNIRLSVEEDIDEFKYSEYRYFESIANSIADELNADCSLELEFLCEDDDFHSIYVDATNDDEDTYKHGIRIKELDLNEDFKNLFRRDLQNFLINVSIQGEEVFMDDLNVSEDLKQSKDIIDFVNNIVALAKNKEDFIVYNVSSSKDAKDLINLLVSDLKILYLTDYFEPFFDCNCLLKDKAISIYHNNRTREKRDLINIYHQGYCFNWNAYNYDNEDIKNLYFNVFHSYEDLSWLNSTCSKYYDRPVDGHCLDGRGIREVNSQGHFGLNKVLYKYFDKSISSVLSEGVELEIMLNKGKAVTWFIDKEEPDFVVGFNENKEKVFSLSYDGDRMGIEGLKIEYLVSQINYLISDINTKLKKELDKIQIKNLNKKEDPIKWELE